MWKIFVVFGLLAGGFALNAQGVTQPGTVAPSSQTLPSGTPTNRAVVPELDTRGKAIYWWRHGFGVGILAADVLVARVNQVNGTPPEWQGAAGFGKRLGDTVGSSSIAAGIGFGCRRPSIWIHAITGARLAASGGTLGLRLTQSFVYHTDSGKLAPAIPELASIYGAAMISMSWYPSRYEPLSDGVRRANYVMLARFGFNLIREFAPEKAPQILPVDAE